MGQDKNETDCVYHYTTAAGLLGMVQTQKLWATELASLNDPDELRAGIKTLENLLTTEPLVDNPHRGAVYDALNMIADRSARDWTAFTLSATRRTDDVNSWRAYADEGRGYCVGFDARIPLVPPIVPDERDARVVLWQNVSYGNEQRLREQLSRLISQEHGEQTPNVIFTGEVDWTETANLSLNRIVHLLALLIKYPGYASEEEVRCVAVCRGSEHVEFRESQGGIRRHIEMQVIGKNAETPIPVLLPIRSITVGPRLDYVENRYAIKALLENNDYEHVSFDPSSADGPVIQQSHITMR